MGSLRSPLLLGLHLIPSNPHFSKVQHPFARPRLTVQQGFLLQPAAFGASIEGSKLGQGPQAKLQSPTKVMAAERAPALLPEEHGAATSPEEQDGVTGRSEWSWEGWGS